MSSATMSRQRSSCCSSHPVERESCCRTSPKTAVFPECEEQLKHQQLFSAASQQLEDNVEEEGEDEEEQEGQQDPQLQREQQQLQQELLQQQLPRSLLCEKTHQVKIDNNTVWQVPTRLRFVKKIGSGAYGCVASFEEEEEEDAVAAGRRKSCRRSASPSTPKKRSSSRISSSSRMSNSSKHNSMDGGTGVGNAGGRREEEEEDGESRRSGSCGTAAGVSKGRSSGGAGRDGRKKSGREEGGSRSNSSRNGGGGGGREEEEEERGEEEESSTTSTSKKRLAVKKIGDLFRDLIDAKRIYREIKILKELQHENIISLVEILDPLSPDFDDIYLVSDLMDTDLHRVIYSRQALTAEHHQYFLYQLLLGLSFLHQAEIIHRDLKPSNILVNLNCDIKICDFGLARGLYISPKDMQTSPLGAAAAGAATMLAPSSSGCCNCCSSFNAAAGTSFFSSAAAAVTSFPSAASRCSSPPSAPAPASSSHSPHARLLRMQQMQQHHHYHQIAQERMEFQAESTRGGANAVADKTAANTHAASCRQQQQQHNGRGSSSARLVGTSATRQKQQQQQKTDASLKAASSSSSPSPAAPRPSCRCSCCCYGCNNGPPPAPAAAAFTCEEEVTRNFELTDYVVTRWYRPPEILISPFCYSKPVDLWSVGCIFAELLGRRALFAGKDHFDQLRKIIRIMGRPTSAELNKVVYEGRSCPVYTHSSSSNTRDAAAAANADKYAYLTATAAAATALGGDCRAAGKAGRKTGPSRLSSTKHKRSDAAKRFIESLPYNEPYNLADLFPDASRAAIDLLSGLLAFDPENRLTVEEALRHEYFDGLHSPGDEPRVASPVDWSFDNFIPTKRLLQNKVYEEILSFHPEIVLRDFPVLPSRGILISSASLPTHVRQPLALLQQQQRQRAAAAAVCSAFPSVEASCSSEFKTTRSSSFSSVCIPSVPPNPPAVRKRLQQQEQHQQQQLQQQQQQTPLVTVMLQQQRRPQEEPQQMSQQRNQQQAIEMAQQHQKLQQQQQMLQRQMQEQALPQPPQQQQQHIMMATAQHQKQSQQQQQVYRQQQQQREEQEEEKDDSSAKHGSFPSCYRENSSIVECTPQTEMHTDVENQQLRRPHLLPVTVAAATLAATAAADQTSVTTSASSLPYCSSPDASGFAAGLSMRQQQHQQAMGGRLLPPTATAAAADCSSSLAVTAPSPPLRAAAADGGATAATDKAERLIEGSTATAEASSFAASKSVPPEGVYSSFSFYAAATALYDCPLLKDTPRQQQHSHVSQPQHQRSLASQHQRSLASQQQQSLASQQQHHQKQRCLQQQQQHPLRQKLQQQQQSQEKRSTIFEDVHGGGDVFTGGIFNECAAHKSAGPGAAYHAPTANRKGIAAAVPAGALTAAARWRTSPPRATAATPVPQELYELERGWNRGSYSAWQQPLSNRSSLRKHYESSSAEAEKEGAADAAVVSSPPAAETDLLMSLRSGLHGGSDCQNKSSNSSKLLATEGENVAAHTTAGSRPSSNPSVSLSSLPRTTTSFSLPSVQSLTPNCPELLTAGDQQLQQHRSGGCFASSTASAFTAAAAAPTSTTASIHDDCIACACGTADTAASGDLLATSGSLAGFLGRCTRSSSSQSSCSQQAFYCQSGMSTTGAAAVTAEGGREALSGKFRHGAAGEARVVGGETAAAALLAETRATSAALSESAAAAAARKELAQEESAGILATTGFMMEDCSAVAEREEMSSSSRKSEEEINCAESRQHGLGIVTHAAADLPDSRQYNRLDCAVARLLACAASLSACSSSSSCSSSSCVLPASVRTQSAALHPYPCEERSQQQQLSLPRSSDAESRSSSTFSGVSSSSCTSSSSVTTTSTDTWHHPEHGDRCENEEMAGATLLLLATTRGDADPETAHSLLASAAAVGSTTPLQQPQPAPSYFSATHAEQQQLLEDVSMPSCPRPLHLAKQQQASLQPHMLMLPLPADRQQHEVQHRQQHEAQHHSVLSTLHPSAAAPLLPLPPHQHQLFFPSQPFDCSLSMHACNTSDSTSAEKPAAKSEAPSFAVAVAISKRHSAASGRAVDAAGRCRLRKQQWYLTPPSDALRTVGEQQQPPAVTGLPARDISEGELDKADASSMHDPLSQDGYHCGLAAAAAAAGGCASSFSSSSAVGAASLIADVHTFKKNNRSRRKAAATGQATAALAVSTQSDQAFPAAHRAGASVAEMREVPVESCSVEKETQGDTRGAAATASADVLAAAGGGHPANAMSFNCPQHSHCCRGKGERTCNTAPLPRVGAIRRMLGGTVCNNSAAEGEENDGKIRILSRSSDHTSLCARRHEDTTFLLKGREEIDEHRAVLWAAAAVAAPAATSSGLFSLDPSQQGKNFCRSHEASLQKHAAQQLQQQAEETFFYKQVKQQGRSGEAATDVAAVAFRGSQPQDVVMSDNEECSSNSESHCNREFIHRAKEIAGPCRGAGAAVLGAAESEGRPQGGVGGPSCCMDIDFLLQQEAAEQSLLLTALAREHQQHQQPHRITTRGGGLAEHTTQLLREPHYTGHVLQKPHAHPQGRHVKS